MSTPAGHSEEQALQDRHRSRASRTSGARQPPVTRVPLTISCSTRARPRVESFSSLVAWYDGHITRVVPAVLATHLPTPEQRCTAAEKLASWPVPRDPAVAGPAVRYSWAARTSASRGRGRTPTPGLSTPAGLKTSLTRPNRAIAAGEYITGSSSLRARPSPCSPDSDPP